MNRKLLINYESFVVLRKKSRKQFVYSPFASTFKSARLSLGKTLNAVVGKICSLSYVSKYENNLLLPDEDVLRVLFDNVGINYDLLQACDMTNYLCDMIKSYLRHDCDRLQELFDRAQSSYFIAQNALAICFYYLAMEMYDQCAREIEKVDAVKTTLNDYQVLVLSTVTIELYIKTERFLEAKELLHIQKNMYKEYPEMKALYHEERFLVALSLRDDLHILSYYNELQSNYLYTYPLKKQIRNKMLYLETQWEEDLAYQEIMAMEYDYIPEEYRHEYRYSKYLMLIRTGREHELIADYQDLEDKTPSLLALFALAVRRGVDHPLVRPHYDTLIPEIMSELKSFTLDKKSEQEIVFIKLILLQLNEEKASDVMEYMKARILPYMAVHQHRLYTPYFVETYLFLLETCSRYKEATIFAKKYIRYVKNLNKDEN